MNPQQLAGLLGFLFVAAWIAFGFGNAILCLLGAAGFYAATAFYRGELDLADLQQRATRQTRTTRSPALTGRSPATTKRGNEMSRPTANDGEPRAAEPTHRDQPAARAERLASRRAEPADADQTERTAAPRTTAHSAGPADTHDTERSGHDGDQLMAADADGADQKRSGRRPEGPAHARQGSAAQTIKRTLTEFSEDNLTDAAAALTYYAILSLFPALLALVSIVGLVADPHTVTKEMTTLVTSIGPASAAQTFKGPIDGLTKNSGTAGILLIVGIVSALWSASGYVGAFMRASNVIYEVEEGRSLVRLRPLQMLVTLLLVLLLALVLVALVLTGPLASKVGAAVGIGSCGDGLEHRQMAGSVDRRDVHDRVAVLRVAERQAAQSEVDLPWRCARGGGMAGRVRGVRVVCRELQFVQQDLRHPRRDHHLLGLGVADQCRDPPRGRGQCRT